MTAQETNLLNAFETTLTGTIGASDLTFTVNSVTDSASNTLAAPCYLILNPDSATNREVVQVTSINAGTKTLTLDNINKRYLTGSAATSGLSHASGSVVRMSPVQQHIEDINDRVDTIINEAGTAVNTSLFLDEDDMSSNSATKGVTQQSVKAYVDTQLTAEDLDISADSGSNIAIDLDSEVLDLEGGTGIDTTTGTNKVTFAIDSTVATLTGSQALTNKTINVDSNTVSNIEVDNLKSGVLDTDLSSVSGSDDTLASAKAIKTYVDTQITAEDLDTAGNSGTGSVDLDSQSLTVSGDGTILTSTASGQGITFAIADASTSAKGAASFSSDNFAVSSGAVTIKDSGVSNDELAGSIANAKLANSSITVTDGSSSTATALGGTITFSGTSNEVEVAESSGTITIGLPSTVNVNVTGTINATSVLADGVTATTQSAGDNSTKVATTAYVDAIDSDDDLTVSDGSSSTTINLDSQSLTIAGTANEIETTATAQTLTISLPATINANTTGNAATATALETARTIAGKSFDGTGNITIAAGDLSNVSTSGVSDGQVLVYNNSASEFQPGSVGSATALIDGDSDFTLSDGIANGIHYELDNVDTADWNQGGIALTAVGGLFRHNQTQNSTYTIAATEGAVCAGPITIGSGTVTVAGTMVIL
jgi:hypothetical protein